MAHATALIALVGIALAASSCDRTGVDGDDSALGQPLRRGNAGEPNSLDPALAEDVQAFNVLIDMYEGLISETADGSLSPGVASSWSVSKDGLVYTFEIRDDARWSNGDQVTAGDFVRSLRRIAAPETASAYAFLLEPIANFPDVNADRKPAAELGVVALSDRQLEIRLSAPTSHWLSVLALPIAFPTHISGDVHVSNGAYTMVDHQVNGPLRLRKNSRYWSANSVEIEEVIYLPIVDSVTEFNMYRAGDLDITSTIPREYIDIAAAEFGSETRIAPALALYYLAFDLLEPPFDNALLRQALTMAIDREQLVALLGRGEQAAYGVVPPGVNSYANASFDWMSMAKDSRERLAQEKYMQAGYSQDSPLRFTYLYDADDVHEHIALAVTGMWRDILGVEATLEKREWKYFLDTREQREEWDVMRFAWSGDYNSANTFLDIFQSESPQNLPLYRNSDYDRQLVAAAVQIEPKSAAARMREAEITLIEDYPIAPLYFYVSKHMVKPTVTGFEDSVVDRHPSKYLKLSR